MALFGIVVIEDSAVTARLIASCLVPMGAEVVIRADGTDGLAAISTHRPDLVVLDLGLPTLDGWQVLHRLRADPGKAGLPVIVLTAQSTEPARVRALAMGATAFLAKPFRPTELVKLVRQILVPPASP
jgi:DNA-binding response OmpR family regulator